MFSLRARVFVTVAIVLAAATVASGLLSRRATLVEDREVFGPRRLPPLDGVADEIQNGLRVRRLGRDQDDAEGDRRAARQPAARAGSKNHPIAASSTELEKVTCRRRRPTGTCPSAPASDGTLAKIEMRGRPGRSRPRCAKVWRSGASTSCRRIRDAARSREPHRPPAGFVSTVGTAALALLLAFALSGRILRPVGELTAAAHRMRQGDLDVRVTPRGDDEIARLARAFNEMAERLGQIERTKRQMVERRRARAALAGDEPALRPRSDPGRPRRAGSRTDRRPAQRNAAAAAADRRSAGPGPRRRRRARARTAAGGRRGDRPPRDGPGSRRRAGAGDDRARRRARDGRPGAARADAAQPDQQRAPAYAARRPHRHPRRARGRPACASPWPIPDAGFRPSTCRTCSSGSTAPIRRAIAPPAAPASGSPSSAAWPRRTAAPSRRRARAPIAERR